MSHLRKFIMMLPVSSIYMTSLGKIWPLKNVNSSTKLLKISF